MKTRKAAIIILAATFCSAPAAFCAESEEADQHPWMGVLLDTTPLPDLLIIPLPDCYKDLNAWAQARHDAQPAFDKLLPRVRRR